MIHDIIQMSYLLYVAIITFLIFVFFNSTFSGKRRQMFLAGGIISFFMVTCNVISLYYQEHTASRWLIQISNAVSFSISGPVMLPFIHLLSVFSKRTMNFLLGCAFFNSLLCIISIFTGCIFTVDEHGMYVLGKYSLVPYILTGLYLSILLIGSVKKYRLGSQAESIFISILSICILIATILNTFLHFHFLVSGMSVLSCIFYYIFFVTQTLSRDALTGALNRHSFYKDVQRMKRRQMFVISMDLNGLKQINDTLGHDEGDKAILAVSESVFSFLPNKYRFYRMGGDEFALLCPDASLAETRTLCEKLKENVKSKNYSVAAGYDEYRKGMDFDEVFRIADAMMYDDKQKMKSLMNA